MKTLMTCLLVLFMFSISSYAETAGQEGQAAGVGQQMKMCPKMQQMQGQGMMQAGGHQMPMMGQMMGHGMMMHDMMQMMTDMLDVQEKIVSGVKKAEKKELLNKIKDMKAKMQNAMSMGKCMMCGMMGGMMSGTMEHQPPCPQKESEGKEKEKEKQEEHVH